VAAGGAVFGLSDCTWTELYHNVQLYIDGELVGGADIIEEMHKKGELKELINVKA
jgi:glutaredoxin-related protein